MNVVAYHRIDWKAFLRIMEIGPCVADFDPTSAVYLWLSTKGRRPDQRKRRDYAKRKDGKITLTSVSGLTSVTNSDSEGEGEPEFRLFDN